MDDQAQGVVNGVYSSWRLLTSAVLQESLLGPVLFSIFIHDLEEAIERTVIKPAGDTRLGGPVHILEGRAATQKDLHRLEVWDDRNLMKFNKVTWKAPGWGRKNPWQQHRLGNNRVGNSSAEKDLGSW